MGDIKRPRTFIFISQHAHGNGVFYLGNELLKAALIDMKCVLEKCVIILSLMHVTLTLFPMFTSNSTLYMQMGTWRSWSGKVCNKLTTSARKKYSCGASVERAVIISSEKVLAVVGRRKYSIHVNVEINKNFKHSRENKYILRRFSAFNILWLF
jgi:hypothetical protein